MRKNKKNLFLAVILGIILIANSVYTPQVMANEKQYLAANNAVISDNTNTIAVSGNAIAVSENAIAVSGNAITVSENAIAVSGNAIAVSENAIAVSENTITDFQDSITVSENDITVSENTITIFENSVMQMSNSGAESENIIPGSQNAITVSENDKSESVSNEEVLPNEEGNTSDTTDKIWIAGFERESEELTYTGAKIYQDIRVYHEDKLLAENVDYTLTYSNNVKAASFDSAKAPAVKITMKGQYAGSRTLYYTIAPRKLNEIDTLDYEQFVPYKKNLSIPQPKLFMRGKQLVSGVDFICDYSSLPLNYQKGDSYKPGEVYEYTAIGTGNYAGSLTMYLTVIEDKNHNFANASVKLDRKTYPYCGQALSKEEVKIIRLKVGETTLAPALYDYSVHTDLAGSGYIEVFPTQEGFDKGYRGKKNVKFKVVGDRLIKNAGLGEKWKDFIVYSAQESEEKNGFFQEKEGVLIYPSQEEKEELLEGRDYSVTYSKNKKAGEATVVFKGMGRYSGTLKKTYRILPNKELEIQWRDTDSDGNPVEVYTKGGVVPHFVMTEKADVQKEWPLVENRDYTVKVADNRKTGIMKCEITGKGNYKGYHSTTYVEIVSADIAGADLLVKDMQYSNRKDAWKSPVKIKDVNGKILKAGTDYDRNIVYEYEGMTEGGVPQAQTVVNVKVNGINNYAGTSVCGKYRIYSKDIRSLIIVIDSKEYTGRPVVLDKKDIHVYACKKDMEQGKEITDLCYEVGGYSDNTRVGKAKVMIRGIGDYGATRVCSFQIMKKQFLTQRVEAVLLDAASGKLGVGNSVQLTATVMPENAGNKTIIWSTTDKKVADVNKEGLVTAKGPGKAVIRAVSQDNGKKAEYKIKVEFIPVTSIVLKEEKVVLDAGTQYQLEIVSIMPQNASPEQIYWESSNPEAVEVDDKGMVTFVKAGMAVVSAYTKGKSAVAKCLAMVDYTGDIPEGNYLIPQDYRTVEQEDDTAAINMAIDTAQSEGKDVYIPEGIYRIDAKTGIRPRSGVDFIMSQDAVLQAIDNSSPNYNVIHLRDVKDITIFGGQVKGDRYGHKDPRGEWGMGIGIYDSKRITVSDVDVSDCWGDGIYLGSGREFGENPGCNRITIQNCDLNNNRRNNLSIVCADNVTVDGCSFRNANGTAPQFGIDIETNNYNNPCEYITISNSTFSGNKEAAMGIMTVANDVSVTGCTMDGMFINRAGKNVRLANSTMRGEMYAVIGVSLGDGVVFNAGTEKEDVPVASFKAGEGNYTYGSYQLDDKNAMSAKLVEDTISSTGKALQLKRQAEGTHEAGYYLSIKEMTGGKMKALKPGTYYRFEYVVRGKGQWGFKSNQTAWYPINPRQENYGTCYATYKANAEDAGRVMLYAVDNAKDVYLLIESVNIYEVR